MTSREECNLNPAGRSIIRKRNTMRASTYNMEIKITCRSQSWAQAQCLFKEHAQLLKYHHTKTNVSVPLGWKNLHTLIYIWKLLIRKNWIEWMTGICHIWSRGRHFSPSLPGDRYLNLGSKSDLRAEISGSIVWYDALAPRPEVLFSFTAFYANLLWLYWWP